ncbi:MAG: exopolysaccharide biosynthesis polyprenyl glycosylphosphotransferase [Methylocella sp.]
MFESRLSDIVKPRGRAKTDSRFISEFKISSQNIEILAWIVDLFLLAIASTLGGIVFQHVWFEDPDTVEACLSAGIVNGVLYVCVVSARGLYRLPVLLAPLPYFGRLLAIFASTAFLTACTLLFMKGNGAFPASPLVAALLSQMILLAVGRWVFAKATRALQAAESRDGRRAVTIGELAELLGFDASLLSRYGGLREFLQVAFATNRGRRPGNAQARLEGALAAAREYGAYCAEKFLTALRWARQELLEPTRSGLCESPLPVRVLPGHNIRTLLGRRGLATNGVSLPMTLQMVPLTAFETAVKRTLDVVVSLTAILFLSPLFLIAAVAIKLDSGGPIIFQQRRTGFNGNEFVIFKFRTMSVLEDGPAITQACRDDPRATRVGKFLRRSSIDELPQLLNVLRGEMSLVGPRPHAVAHDREYKVRIADYGFRHRVKPGITGWAQVNGLRGETRSLEEMTGRVKLDLWYINNWSLGFDIKILVRTCFEVLRDQAY